MNTSAVAQSAQMVDITVKVPGDRLADFYSMYGAWLAGADEPRDEVELDEWSKDDLNLAAELWKRFSPQAKALFSHLIDKPEVPFSGDELAGLLGVTKGKHGVAGILAWPGRYCVEMGRTWPWSWDYPEGGNARYWLDKDMADLFNQARQAL